MQVGQIIRMALDELRQDGWCIDYLFESETGKMCAQGAVNQVLCGVADRRMNGDPRFDAVMSALVNYIPSDFDPADYWSKFGSFPGQLPDADMVACYNNTRTSFTDIEEWFEKAAANEGYEVE